MRNFRTFALLLLVLTVGCFRPSGNTRALRDAVLAAAGDGWSREIELGVGPLTFSVARGGTRFLDLPDEARTVIRAMRGADVGVYRYEGAGRPKVGAAVLRAADRGMAERGWERVVAVLDGDESVSVYTPKEYEAGSQLRLSVVVVDGSEMVIVSARGNPEPLINLALEKARESIPARR